MSMTPYGKDKAPDRVGMLAMRAAGVRFGHLNCSRLTGFESPDPQFGSITAMRWSRATSRHARFGGDRGIPHRS